MKQYTDDIQTAKLIELGVEKPKNTQYVQRAKARNLHSPFIEFGESEFEGSYSIGELIEMLPRTIKLYYNLNIFSTSQGWWVLYGMISDCDMWSIEYELYRGELIDALYDTIVKLKEKGVI